MHDVAEESQHDPVDDVGLQDRMQEVIMTLCLSHPGHNELVQHHVAVLRLNKLMSGRACLALGPFLSHRQCPCEWNKGIKEG